MYTYENYKSNEKAGIEYSKWRSETFHPKMKALRTKIEMLGMKKVVDVASDINDVKQQIEELYIEDDQMCPNADFALHDWLNANSGFSIGPKEDSDFTNARKAFVKQERANELRAWQKRFDKENP
jgi:hypothetical protein